MTVRDTERGAAHSVGLWATGDEAAPRLLRLSPEGPVQVVASGRGTHYAGTLVPLSSGDVSESRETEVAGMCGSRTQSDPDRKPQKPVRGCP